MSGAARMDKIHLLLNNDGREKKSYATQFISTKLLLLNYIVRAHVEWRRSRRVDNSTGTYTLYFLVPLISFRSAQPLAGNPPIYQCRRENGWVETSKHLLRVKKSLRDRVRSTF